MCGFVGYLPGSEAVDHIEMIGKMTDVIKHRGPNSAGAFVSDGAIIGFRRLAIIDVSEEANQPLYNKDKTLAMVFNGEIYNFKALRAELEALGYEFQSQTDSEVVVHGYDCWGADVTKKLRGMFAFAIWDEKKQELFIARDMFGIKPVYYGAASEDGTFFFGSEIKSFLPHPQFKKVLNERALRSYLTFQYPATRETFFKGIYKLEPGTWMRVKNGEVIEREKYWDFDFEPDKTMSMQQAVEEITDVLRDSVKVHQVADVKVGAFLSGGIDSSFITALFRPENTFSVGFKDYDGIFNETDLGRRLSEILGFKHHMRLIDADDFFNVLPTIQYHLDEPQSNLSTVPLYFLSELASEYVTVVLSGEGADELFGGYDTYMDTPHLESYKKLPYRLRRIAYHVAKKLPDNRLTNLAIRGGETPEEGFIGQAKIFPEDEALRLLQPPYRDGVSVDEILQPIYYRVAGKDDLTLKQVVDIRTWMPGDILLKADKMSCAHSLELRVPFLDKEVMTVAEKLPSWLRVDGQTSKIALRTAALAELPEEWAKRKKNGFPVPIRDWLREEKWYNYVKEYFNKPYVSEFFDRDMLMGYLDEHYEGRALRQRYIYTVLSFLIWYEEYFVKR